MALTNNQVKFKFSTSGSTASNTTDNGDIIFDSANHKIYARGQEWIGTDTHAANYFAVYSGDTSVSSFGQLADASIKFIAGSNVTLTPNATNHTITIASSYTNTLNTAGTTNKASTKLFLVGAESQAANPVTYSNSNVYIGTDNCLYSNGSKVLTSHQSLANYSTLANTIKTVAWDSTNKKITTTTAESGATASSVLEFAAGNNVTLTAAAGKLTIGSSYTNTTYSFTSGTTTAGYALGEFGVTPSSNNTLQKVKVAGLGDAAGKTVSTTLSASGSNLPTEKAVADYVSTALTSAMQYKGTIGTGGSVTALPDTAKVGDVYVVSAAGTYASKACEVGDYIICRVAKNGTTAPVWDVLNGENQVTDSNPTLTWSTKSKVATVDGVDINVTMPANPNTDNTALTNGTTKVSLASSTGLTLTGGTNKFTVSNGTTSFDVSVTPSISNNVTGSGLTAEKIILGNGSSTIKTSSVGIATAIGIGSGTATSTTYNSTSDSWVPTVKAVENRINAHSGIDKTGTVTSVATGTGLTGGTITTSGTISLLTATTSAIGGMKASNALTTAVTLTSSNGSTANRYYGIQVDKDGQAFVNVPWTDTTYSTSNFAAASHTHKVKINGTVKSILQTGTADAYAVDLGTYLTSANIIALGETPSTSTTVAYNASVQSASMFWEDI